MHQVTTSLVPDSQQEKAFGEKYILWPLKSEQKTAPEAKNRISSLTLSKGEKVLVE